MTKARLQALSAGRRGDPSPTPAGPFTSFGEQLLAIARAAEIPRSIDPRLEMIQTRAAAGGSEQVPSDGGFLVQPDFTQQLMTKLYTTGELLKRVTRIPITKPNSNGTRVPSFDEQSRAGGSRFGGATSYWLTEGGAPTASKPKFRLIELAFGKLIGLCYATDEMVEDAAVLGSALEIAFNGELIYRIEDAILFGDGSAGQLLGVTKSNALIKVSAETGQAAGSVVAENIKNMWARCWGPSRSRAVWLVHQDVEPLLMTLSLTVGAGGSALPLYVPTEDPEAQPYNLMLGRPVIASEYCKAPGTPGDILLVDATEYVTADKGGIDSAVSIHVRFVSNESAFRFVLRIAGQPGWHVPLTPANGTNTLSPFVALAAR